MHAMHGLNWRNNPVTHAPVVPFLADVPPVTQVHILVDELVRKSGGVK